MRRGLVPLFLLAIVVPVAFGLYVRLNDISVWKKSPKTFFYKNRALFTSYDAFYFARLGKEFFEGKYKAGERDPLKSVPDNYLTDNITYPSIVPMSSFLAGLIAKLKGTFIENVDMYFTPVLSVLFVIPLVIFFWRMGLYTTAFSGALVGALSYIYLIRTSIVRFDTDSLNLFYPFAIALFLHLAMESEGRRRYLYLVCAGVLGQLFYWWYFHPGITNALLGLFFVAEFVRFKLEKRPLPWKDWLFALLFFNPYIVGVGVFNLVGSIKSYLINYFHPSISGFPNVQQSISELRHFDMRTLAKVTCGNMWLFIIGLAGAGGLFFRRFKEVLLLLPVFFIGLMALKGGNRFGMFLAPFVGAGFGYLLDKLVAYAGKRREALGYAGLWCAFALVAAVVLLANRPSFSFVAYPRVTPALEADFLKLKEMTPSDAWIWTWWDYGYAIQYLSERATFHDGGDHGTPKTTYFVARTFSTPDQRLANVIIKSISAVGNTQVKKWLEEGVSAAEIAGRIFSGKYAKPLKHPVYWVFTQDLVGKFGWINYFGTWDIAAQKGLRNPIMPLACRIEAKRGLFICNVGVIDVKNGVWITLERRQVPIKAFVLRKGNKVYTDNLKPNGFYLVGRQTDRGLFLYLMAEQPFLSSFVKMYILGQYDRRYFKLVYDNFPVMVVYKVL